MSKKVLFHTEHYLNGGRLEYWIEERFIINDKDPDFEFDTIYIPPKREILQSLQDNADKRAVSDGKFKSGEGAVYASIHPSMFRIWAEKYGLEEGWETTPDGMDFLLKLLDNPEYSKFRVYEGRIGNANTFKEV